MSALQGVAARRGELGAALLGRLRPITVATVRVLRDFVWADLRAGLVDIRGLSLATQGLVLFGFALLFLMIWALVNNDAWRAQSALLPLANAVPRRGTLLPVVLTPATLFVLSVGWGFALTGALHAHPAYRLGVVYLYLLIGLSWTDTSGISDPTAMLQAWGLLAAVPLFFAVRWRARPRPAPEFAVLFVLAAATFVIVQAQGIEAWRVSGVPLVLGYLGLNLLSYTILVIPFLYLAGTGMADFAIRAADWSLALIDRLPRRALGLVLLGLLVWRLREVGLDAATRLAGGPSAGAWLPYLGALPVPLAVGLAWWIVSAVRRPGAPSVPTVEGVVSAAARAMMPLILIYSLVNLLAWVLAESLFMVVKLGIGYPATMLFTEAAVGVLNSSAVLLGWHLVVDALAVGLGVWLAGRGRLALAAFVAIFGLIDLYRELSQPGRPFSALSDPDQSALIDFWWVVIFGVVTVVWAARRQLTPERVSRLLLLVLLTALLRQTDFISNRFSVFGFAGVGFLAFGLVWDALTVGTWANVESRALPRLSRVFLYLGYMLLTVAVVNWALTTHDLAAQARLTGEMALAGFNRFGRPMIYAIFAVVLAAPAASRAGVAVAGGGEREPAT